MTRGEWNMRMMNWWMIGCALVACVFLGCTNENDDSITSTGNEPQPDSSEIVILEAAYAGPPIIPFGSTGDLWMSTWGDDDKLYMTWGDGGGPGQDPTNPMFQTDAGVAALEGSVPYFTNTASAFECIRSIHIPDGIAWEGQDDKPSSILCIDGRLYLAGRTPAGDNPVYGYIAYSDDYGLNWTEVADSPWTLEVNSVFRILMMINMGKNYELNSDGYVYAIGIGNPCWWSSGEAFLCRVGKYLILDYSSFEYLSEIDSNENPVWSSIQSDAIPLDGLDVHQLGAAVYHPGSRHFILLTDHKLYVAPNPWGPWQTIRIVDNEYKASWDGGYMPGIISKDMGLDYFYFTLAGQDTVITYNCHLGKIELQLAQVLP
jgi:hypothetical protein